MEWAAMIIPVIFAVLIIIRIVILQRVGITAVKFGRKNKSDFLLIPLFLLYYYIIAAEVLDLPQLGEVLFDFLFLKALGLAGLLFAVGLFAKSLHDFKHSFRIGIDEDKPSELITTGTFAISRNPLYTAFLIVLISNFLLISNWVLLIYVFVGFIIIHRQIREEEQSLRDIYGEEYERYRSKVPRYLIK